MSSRWIQELAIPGRPDLSSIHASYAFAGLLAVGLVLAQLSDFWPWFTLGMIALGLQIRLFVGIVYAKLRTSLPAPVGHAKMFSNQEALSEIGWLRASGGVLASAAVIAACAIWTAAE